MIRIDQANEQDMMQEKTYAAAPKRNEAKCRKSEGKLCKSQPTKRQWKKGECRSRHGRCATSSAHCNLLTQDPSREFRGVTSTDTGPKEFAPVNSSIEQGLGRRLTLSSSYTISFDEKKCEYLPRHIRTTRPLAELPNT